VTKATAFEIQTVQQYTESEFGMHAALKDQWLSEVVRLFLRALIAAMQSTSDYAGAFKEQDVEFATVGAQPEPGSDGSVKEDEAQEKAKVLSELQAFQAPFIDDDQAKPLGVQEVSAKETAIVQESLKLRGSRGELIEVKVEDLDAEFDISFVEGGRTPLTDAAMQQNLVALLKPYSELWTAAQQPGPMGAFAKAYMQVMAERFEFPKDLYPEALEARAKSSGEAAAPGPGEPKGAAPPQQMEIPPEMQQVLGQILHTPPADALKVLRSLFSKSPQMLAALDEVAKLPLDQQAAMIEQMVTGLLQASQQGGQAPTNGNGATPPATQPTMPAEGPPVPGGEEQ
jgi:hypothetical protein